MYEYIVCMYYMYVFGMMYTGMYVVCLYECVLVSSTCKCNLVWLEHCPIFSLALQ